jgi:dTDP-3-amino-3,4,6-trideoxy-alpha-D-glucose transaminase
MMRVPYVDLPGQHAPLEEEILEAVRRVLRHGGFILGPEVETLEEMLAERLGVARVVGVASGTDALTLALRLRGIGEGDEVLVPSHSFLASAHAVRLVGAEPVFVDIESRRMLMDPARLEAALTPATRAVMPVHLGGHPCDMDAITTFTRAHGLELVEDCAQAIGTRWRGRSVGDFGLGCFSLHPLKTLSAAGDAGFITVHDEDEDRRLRLMRNFGLLDRDHTAFVTDHSRLDTLQAAILLVKLRRLDGYLAARKAHAAAYSGALAGAYRVIPVPEEAEPSWSTYVVRHPERDRILEALRERGFDVKVHYPVPIHRQEPYLDEERWTLPETNQGVAEMMSLPVTPELADHDREALIAALLELA